MLRASARDSIVSLMLRLWIEFVLLYVALPVAVLGVKQAGVCLPVLPVLWVAAYPAVRYLMARCGWGPKELTGLSLSREQALRLVLRLVVATVVLAVGILLVAPGQFLELPRTNLRLWTFVMVFYPLLSVYPQGILYRGLFFSRYARLFNSTRAAGLAGTVVFSLAHIVFANVWAVILTFAGGLLINHTYRKTGSLLASDLEHMVYGQLAFSLGWGFFLNQGTLGMMESMLKG